MFKILSMMEIANDTFNLYLFSMKILHNYEIYYDYEMSWYDNSFKLIYWNAWQREQNQLGKHWNGDKYEEV